jgi:hypothetical protein
MAIKILGLNEIQVANLCTNMCWVEVLVKLGYPWFGLQS